ncbi:MAG: hypothetical protein OSB02_02160 [Rhodospirillaceae bacterium]|nr:hypothetical protein [Rhodospirillaceae bacterium]
MRDTSYYAIALIYDMEAQDGGGKGPLLAHAQYAVVEVDQEILPEHYKAVAEIVGYVMQVNGKGQADS